MRISQPDTHITREIDEEGTTPISANSFFCLEDILDQAAVGCRPCVPIEASVTEMVENVTIRREFNIYLILTIGGMWYNE